MLKSEINQFWAWIYEGEYVKTVESNKEILVLQRLGVSGVFTEYPKKIFHEMI